MANVKVRLMGLMQRYPPAASSGVIFIDIDPSDTVAMLMARVGQQIGEHFLPALWDPHAGEFHFAVHVFLDGVQVKHRQQAIGAAGEAVFLLQIAGGSGEI